jgi:hypothetical protein
MVTFLSIVSKQIKPPNYNAEGQVLLYIFLFGVGLVGKAGNSLNNNHHCQ